MHHHHHHHHDHKFRKRLVFMHILFGLLFAVLAGVVFGYFVMLLWNALMPDIFGLTAISFWQAVGLVLLSRLLVGSFGHGHGRHHHRHHRHHHWRQHHAKYHANHKCHKTGDEPAEHNMYEEWWEAEGKQALQNYVERIKHTDEV